METGFDPDRHAWDAWHPSHVHDRLRGVAAPWYVAAGWSIDLFLGARRREHDDLEIAVPATRFGEVDDALADIDFFALGDGLARSVEHEPEALDAEGSHQTWGLDRDTGRWRVDVFREPSDGDVWICRRDERIRLPYDEQIEWTSDGIPYARPELTLLFKAKHAREKDDADLAAVLAVLSADRRRYLAELVDLVHPGHRWLDDLQASGGT